MSQANRRTCQTAFDISYLATFSVHSDVDTGDSCAFAQLECLEACKQSCMVADIILPSW